MPKGESTKSYTDKELRAMRRRSDDLTDWKRVDSVTDDELEQLIANDQEEQGLHPDWARAFLVLPEPKAQVTLRVDRDVLHFFRAEGPGYQTRINAVLRAYMLAHQGERRL